ncbi:hypothetical protein LX64_00612 [Chitinophaga skermanii]|uniref:Outer membrane protein with beta-barrel domain n=1 Tax=Chitinophaga skermanii TaxID=331697 RepID=A0A327R466_9BACT|nr:hypothetical protein [Chitinophaga skermanii]RAJ11005.1 hypothetical protein LX64_00612 [Chitinophaga skermanii]
MKQIVFIVSLCSSLYSTAQPSLWRNVHHIVYARTFSANHHLPASHLLNQARLGNLKRSSTSVLYESRFLLPGVGIYSCVFATPLGNGGIGVSFGAVGDRYFKEQQFGIAYGMNINTSMQVGAQFNYVSATGEGLQREFAVVPEVAWLCHITPALSLGLQWYNIGGSYVIKQTLLQIPVIVTVGIGYEISEQVLLEVVCVKASQSSLTAAMKLLYEPVKFLQIQLSTAFQPSMQAISFRWKRGKMGYGIGGSYHVQLGISPNVLLIWQ